MKIVMLAACIGPKVGSPFPMSLTSLYNGRSIMDMRIENLDNSFNINDIYVVFGFKKDPIIEKLKDRWEVDFREDLANANKLLQK